MANILALVPASIREPAVSSVTNFLVEQRRAIQENPVTTIVNTIALSILGFAAINFVASVITVPVIMPAIADGLRNGLMAIAGAIIFTAMQAHHAEAEGAAAPNGNHVQWQR